MTALGFALIAFVTLFTGDYSRRGHQKRIIIAVVIFVTLIALNLGMINLSAKNLSLVPFIYAANSLPIFFSLVILIIPLRLKIWFKQKFSGYNN